MANIFLDTNLFFDIAYRDKTKSEALKSHNLYISPLSCHIYCHSEHVEIPDKDLVSFINNFIIVSLSKNILTKSLDGPTQDLEDNIQLHSARKAGCDYFLTNDVKLLKMKSFGKTKIVSKIPVL